MSLLMLLQSESNGGDAGRRGRFWRFIAALLVLFVPLSLCAAEGAPAPPVRPAVERGMQFLQKEAYRWKAAKGCAACHHAATMIWSFNEAKARGYSVDEAALTEITAWAFPNMQENVRVDQAPPRNVINLGAVYTLMSVETAPAAKTPKQDDPLAAARRALVRHITTKQIADGSWGVPLDLRVPLGGPPEDIAILSRIALLQSGDDSTTVTTCLKKAADWLAVNQDKGSRQARNLRLLMNLREAKPAGELNPVIASIKTEQNADGGWSQTPEMTSDAYATGQSLYVLGRAGVKPDDPGMARGVEFLTRTQQENGSWPMTSRVKAKDMTPITATGAAWAVLGLVRAAP